MRRCTSLSSAGPAASLAGSGSGTGAAAGTLSGAVYKGTINLTWAVALSAQFTSDPDVSRCSEVGKGGTSFSLTVGNLTSQGHNLYILVEHGNLPAIAAGGPITLNNVGSNFGDDSDTDVTANDDTLTINRDGSGSFTFKNAAIATTPNKMLSGALNWTRSG